VFENENATFMWLLLFSRGDTARAVGELKRVKAEGYLKNLKTIKREKVLKTMNHTTLFIKI